jgi:hypothetical protein
MLLNDENKFLDELYTIVLYESKSEEIKKVKEKFNKKRKEIKKKHDDKIENVKDFAKDIGKDYTKDFFDELNEKIRQKVRMIRSVYLAKMISLGKEEAEALKKIQKVKSVSKKSFVVISGLAMAVIIITASLQVYKDERNEIIKKCSQKKGREKQICFKVNRIKALKKRISILNNSAVKCNYSKNPVKCKEKLNEEILRLKERLRKESVKFGEKMRIKL